MSNTGGFSSTRISSIGGDSKDNSYIWTTEKIDQLVKDINNGNICSNCTIVTCKTHDTGDSKHCKCTEC